VNYKAKARDLLAIEPKQQVPVFFKDSKQITLPEGQGVPKFIPPAEILGLGPEQFTVQEDLPTKPVYRTILSDYMPKQPTEDCDEPEDDREDSCTQP
jgi:hypothetical protein